MMGPDVGGSRFVNDLQLEARGADARHTTVMQDGMSLDNIALDGILDACRNNPLARSMRRTTASRSVSGGSFGNLNEDLLGDETLVAYAAAITR